jgi:hypothetical protein
MVPCQFPPGRHAEHGAERHDPEVAQRMEVTPQPAAALFQVVGHGLRAGDFGVLVEPAPMETKLGGLLIDDEVLSDGQVVVPGE